jgi:hypothetical protein
MTVAMSNFMAPIVINIVKAVGRQNDKVRFQFLDRPRRREAAGGHFCLATYFQLSEGPEVTFEFLEGVAKRHPILREQVLGRAYAG